METCIDPNPDGPKEWEEVLSASEIDGVVLSAWGSSPANVFVVGGSLGNGAESLVLNFDGRRWHRLSPGGTETYWWVGGTSASDVWMVGENGRITHWDGGVFSEHVSGVTAKLWGVWAASPTDVWVVGGTPGGGTSAPNDIVLHQDGNGWSQVALPGTPLGRALFKVWGTASDNLWAVGEYGTIWHRQGETWTLESAQYNPPLASGTLFTVHGCSATEVYAVGGSSVLHWDGTAWSKEPVDLYNQVFGVSCGPSPQLVLVGSGGLKMRKVDGAFVDESDKEPAMDLHAAWADGTGTFWAVGGDWFSFPSQGTTRSGVVGRYGSGNISKSIAD
jgi:hypothetical protein